MKQQDRKCWKGGLKETGAKTCLLETEAELRGCTHNHYKINKEFFNTKSCKAVLIESKITI